MNLSRSAGATLCALALVSAYAVAYAGTSTVTIPYGNWLEQALAVLRDVALAAIPVIIAWAGKELPSYAAFILKTNIAEQWLKSAIDRGINAVSGAVKGKALTIDVGSQVAAEAAQYMVDHAPVWLTEWLGGWPGIRERIFARLELAQNEAIPVARG